MECAEPSVYVALMWYRLEEGDRPPLKLGESLPVFETWWVQRLGCTSNTLISREFIIANTRLPWRTWLCRFLGIWRPFRWIILWVRSSSLLQLWYCGNITHKLASLHLSVNLPHFHYCGPVMASASSTAGSSRQTCFHSKPLEAGFTLLTAYLYCPVQITELNQYIPRIHKAEAVAS